MSILNQTVKSTIYGRAFFATDDDDLLSIEVFEYELEPMKSGERGGQDWFMEYLQYETDKRGLLKAHPDLPCQVVFKGTMTGRVIHRYEGDEWEDEFECEESSWAVIPKEFEEAMKGTTP